MKLEIITPKGSTTINDVDSVSVPGSEGRFMVLTMHAPLLSTIKKGEIYYSQKEHRQTISTESGVIEVKDNVIRIITEQ